MIKYYIFGKNLFQYTDFDNIRFMLTDVLNDDNVEYIPPAMTFGEKWILFWTKRRCFRKWTEHFGVPFRKQAYNSYMGNRRINRIKDIQVFLFFKNEKWYFEKKGFLAYLKSTYPNCKTVYKLLNPVRYIDDSIDVLKNNYDLVVVGEPKDSKKYKLPVFEIGYSKAKIENNSKPYCDCFYIGNAKKRLDKIIEVYNKLTENGLKVIFFIVNVPEEKLIQREGIVYNTPLDYDEVIQYVNHSRYLLEIMQEYEENPTLRLLECIAYKKKLLTNNAAVVNSPYYSKENIQVFSDIESIDMSFFDSYVDCEYPNSEKIGPRIMLDSIKKELNI